MKNKITQFNAELEGKILELCKIHNRQAQRKRGNDRKECIYLALEISQEIVNLQKEFGINGTEFSYAIKAICRWDCNQLKLEKELIKDLYRYIEKVKLFSPTN